MTTHRDLLIALGAAFDLPRPAVCRLGLHLERWTGGRPEAATTLGVPAPTLNDARSLLRRAPAMARREEETARRHGARIVTLADPAYPAPLRDLTLPPPSLYVRGTLPPAAPPPGPGGGDRRAVAIVGSRRADPYGREASEMFGRALAAAGITVVSGFARGVDATAHRGALAGASAEGPPCVTVAVLGTGLGVDYPRGHRRLGEEIAERGALVTEFPCGLEPKAWHFPVRNRLIAAMAGATLVVRAARRSGSLVTARFALDLGRDVLAVPGRIFEPRSAGANALIADGAYPALSAADVLQVLGVATSAPTAGDGPESDRSTEETGDEVLPDGLQGRLLGAMTPAAEEQPEALAERIGAPVDRVLGALLELELAGRVRREPGPAYVRRIPGAPWAAVS